MMAAGPFVDLCFMMAFEVHLRRRHCDECLDFSHCIHVILGGVLGKHDAETPEIHS